MFDFRKARMFLELRQIDVARATGLTIPTIARAERGETIDGYQHGILRRFLMARLREELSDAGSGSSTAVRPLLSQS